MKCSLLADILGALKHHVFEEMRKPSPALLLIAGSDIVDQSERDDTGRAVLLDKNNAQPNSCALLSLEDDFYGFLTKHQACPAELPAMQMTQAIKEDANRRTECVNTLHHNLSPFISRGEVRLSIPFDRVWNGLSGTSAVKC
jgi:hypothetical protein